MNRVKFKAIIMSIIIKLKFNIYFKIKFNLFCFVFQFFKKN